MHLILNFHVGPLTRDFRDLLFMHHGPIENKEGLNVPFWKEKSFIFMPPVFRLWSKNMQIEN